MLVDWITRVGILVTLLDQQPDRLLAIPNPRQGESAFQLLAFQPDGYLAIFDGLMERDELTVAFGDIPEGAGVPHDHAPGAIFALWNDALEVAIFERVILSRHGETLIACVHRRPLWNSPRFKDAVDLQAEVIVQSTGVMLLDNEYRLMFRACGMLRSACWLGRTSEVPPAPVLLKQLSPVSLREVAHEIGMSCASRLSYSCSVMTRLRAPPAFGTRRGTSCTRYLRLSPSVEAFQHVSLDLFVGSSDRRACDCHCGSSFLDQCFAITTEHPRSGARTT